MGRRDRIAATSIYSVPSIELTVELGGGDNGVNVTPALNARFLARRMSNATIEILSSRKSKCI